ncbi:helicase-like transcription factor [Asterias amurensis]|uniref:helicase-like transcription factor n=1 Tax=Asterias amurensis TaxID=7602 RepID=UPI003AB303BA
MNRYNPWASGWNNKNYRQRGSGSRRGAKSRGKKKSRYGYETLGRDPWPQDDLDDTDLISMLDRTMAAVSRQNASGDGILDVDDTEDETLFGLIRGAVVGVQYYKGMVNNNEMVALVREPNNQYDSQAIKVENIWGHQVGHIKREMAAALSPLVDGKLVRIDGVVPYGKNNSYRIPVDISVWGKADQKQSVVERLGYRGVRFEPPRGLSEGWGGGIAKSGPVKVYKPRASAAAPVQLTKAEMHNELDKLFEGLKQAEKTTPMEPAEAISSTLYLHQKQALNWMSSRENTDSLPPFWVQQGNGNFLNTVTNYSSTTRPPTVRGGILADEMGLGKTLEMISLILTNFHEGKPLAVPCQDPITIDSDSDGEVKDTGTQPPPGKEEPHCIPVIPVVIPQVEIVQEPVVETLPGGSGEAGVILEEVVPLPSIDSEDVVIVESLQDNEIVIIPDDDDDTKEHLVEPPPKPVEEVVSASSRPQRSSKKPARYVFSDGSDPEAVYEEEVPKKKAKSKSQIAIADSAPPVKPIAVEEQPKKVKKAQPKKGAKAKGDDLPDILQLPNLPQLPTVNLLPRPSPTMMPSTSSTKSAAKVPPVKSSQKGPKTLGLGAGTSSKGPRPTLIVCPLSVLSNWLNQFEEHVRPDVDLNLYTHYGSDRVKSHGKLLGQDVILTTYNTLAADFKAKKGNSPLHKVDWLRVVLDEGHTIRNPSALQTKAVLELKAERKWVLTGTPIQNSIKDLWALMAFLGLEPFKSNRAWWQRTIVRPINQGDKTAIDRISHLMGQIALRRTKTQKVKGELLVDLPSKQVFIQHVELSVEERAVYDSMAKEGKLTIGKYFNKGALLAHYGDVLAILLRLRQLCCHPTLIAAATLKEDEDNGGESDLKKKLITTLLAVLSQGADEECCICLESLRGPVITPCAHVFCARCISDVINNEAMASRCPLCRGNIEKDTLVAVPRQAQQEQKEVIDADWHSSAKVDAVLECLIREREKDPATKSLVVSQFTKLLSLVEKPLRDSGFRFVRLDGSMSRKQRCEAIEAFSSTLLNTPTVFLLSLKAGGVGINLTAASRVFLLDPAWNPASEDQCFDRCHRLGQTKDVVVTKFIVKNSIEERMLELQEKKRKLMASAFSNKMSADEKRQSRINDIQTLMNLDSSGAQSSTAPAATR